MESNGLDCLSLKMLVSRMLFKKLSCSLSQQSRIAAYEGDRGCFFIL